MSHRLDDHGGMEVLTERDCFALLEQAHFGRLGLSVGALPTILPVNFALLGRDPVFRTDAGTKLEAATNGHVLCLEIDDVDTLMRDGWSVVVTGRASVIEDQDELAAARQLPLQPWVGKGSSYVRIRASMVSGRRLRPMGGP